MSRGSALLIIDVQMGMFDEEYPVYEGEKLLEHISSLIAKARLSETPVIYIQHNEAPGESLEPNTPTWEIHSAIKPAKNDVIVQKRTPDSFYKTTLQQELNQLGVHRLILSGIQTEICVDTTCRRAFSLGYDVVLAKDGHSTMDSDNLTARDIIHHHNNVLRWFADTRDSDQIAF